MKVDGTGRLIDSLEPARFNALEVEACILVAIAVAHFVIGFLHALGI